MMRPDVPAPQPVADEVAAGRLKSAVAEVVGLSGLAAAIEHNRTGHAAGKIVIDLAL